MIDKSIIVLTVIISIVEEFDICFWCYGKYVDSVRKTYGKSLDGKDSGSFFSKLGDSFLSLGAKALGNGSSKGDGGKSNLGSSDSAMDIGSNGSGQNYSGGNGLRNQTLGRGGNSSGSNGYGSGTGGGSGSYGSGGLQTNNVTGLTRGETQRVLDGLGREDLSVEEGDTLFDIISKRYKQSAYPKFLNVQDN